MSEIDRRLVVGEEVTRKVREMLSHRVYPGDTKSVLLCAYVDVALEHHQAVWCLTRSSLFGSAFALMRPLIEVLFRALWVNKCATTEQVEAAGTNDDFEFPRMNDMATAIDEAYATENFFKELKDRSWKPLCSYAHSGLLQLGRRFTGHTVKPSYKDGDVLEALNAANIAIILLARMFFVSMGNVAEAEETNRMMLQY